MSGEPETLNFDMQMEVVFDDSEERFISNRRVEFVYPDGFDREIDRAIWEEGINMRLVSELLVILRKRP